MDEELGALMFHAVIVSVQSSSSCIELKVRYFRHGIEKRKEFAVKVSQFPLDYLVGSCYQRQKYEAAAKLKPGDEIFVDPYGEEWCDPIYNNWFRRKWNLIFA